jgi:signal transduction histidine kinase
MALFLALMFGMREDFTQIDPSSARDLLVWTALAGFTNLMPIGLRKDLHVTLDVMILLAVAFLYPPAIAAIAAFVSAIDLREFRREITPTHTLFNRTQIALNVLGASAIFHGLGAEIHDGPMSLPVALLALAVSMFLNVSLLLTHLRLHEGVPVSTGLQRLPAGRPVQFLAVYASYAALAVVLANVYLEVGLWAVGTFLLPIFVAQQMFIRERRLERTTAELRERERLLEGLFDRIVEERKDERQRVAGELHDDVLGTLTNVSMLGHVVRRQLSRSGVSSTDLDNLARNSSIATDTLRSVIRDLHRSPLGRGGLIPTLRSLFRDLALNWQVPIRFEPVLQEDLSPARQLVIYQVAKEAVLNALKHAHASQIIVHLRRTDGHLFLRVNDDGKGFTAESEHPHMHFGIGLMKERARQLGGELRIESVPGTRVELRLPDFNGE